MKKKSMLTLFLSLCFFYWGYSQVKTIEKVTSHDGKTTFQIGVGPKNAIFYQLTYHKKNITAWSAMGLKINGRSLGDSVNITGKTTVDHLDTFAWPLGESSTVQNYYKELILKCKARSMSFSIVIRVFNGGVAFRYLVNGPTAEPSMIDEELTQFNLTRDFTVYQYHEESVFSPQKLSELTNASDLPTTMCDPGQLYLSIGEADNRDYSKCVLIKGQGRNDLKLHFYIDTLYRNKKVSAIKKDTLIRYQGSFKTPWRTICCAESAIGLHEYSDLYIRLAEPAAHTDPGVVKPGKVVRVEVNTDAAIAGIDFAAKHNFSYILIDAGWYGAEFRTTSDPTVPIPAVDIPKIVAYGKGKNIGLILYVNYVGLRQKLDTILPLYKKWGVSGLKFGFVDGGTQKGLSWLDTAMRKVNDFGFILNVHDHYKPTGLSRTYPYQLSQEGIRGDENSPDAFHTMVLPYTRFLAGAADFTFCYPNSRSNFSKNLKVSMGEQLALSVIYFSPLPSIFWYGKPSDYTNEEEIDFFKFLPTVWDESRYLAGEIAQNISVARKRDNIWYIGSATGNDPWHTRLKLGFLDGDRSYEATIYEDDGHKSIRIRKLRVNKKSDLQLDLSSATGQAVIIRPL
ncbi:hypothetical protein BEL04_12275 [Mucilaginibacter sp. PPCGB 2223]|uniref:glycoside hydrolase family 97 protein n=1 Tax=Mucilaginibacter sp. PPCGB 2223 TaxID=1886027 RepID=UPI0008257945|nr:glycoside hydrolase family 97 protein [Mucilaginibacter sp. PPCGB 2223]OCX52249.1 hypothetical protein BEL04_12275 [Mucilaginibacter sp. PPCGB 2223]